MAELMLVHLPLANSTARLAFGHLPTCLLPSLFGIKQFVVYNR
jgi:hypothetical protein